MSKSKRVSIKPPDVTEIAIVVTDAQGNYAYGYLGRDLFSKSCNQLAQALGVLVRDLDRRNTARSGPVEQARRGTGCAFADVVHPAHRWDEEDGPHACPGIRARRWRATDNGT